jgi:hypothetical protein
MPLAFPSLSHGEIAFGFFNIESDLLLLNNYFLFAGDFCADLSEMASQEPDQQLEMDWDLYILDRKDIGNLGGAINGVDSRGFIGETYRLFPFPQEPHLFRQNPEGYKTREIIETIIKKYAKLSRIAVAADKSGQTIAIGEYRFSRDVFHELLHYVWVGGYPLWKDGVRPDYVREMKTNIMQSVQPLFRGMTEQGEKISF